MRFNCNIKIKTKKGAQYHSAFGGWGEGSNYPFPYLVLMAPAPSTGIPAFLCFFYGKILLNVAKHFPFSPGSHYVENPVTCSLFSTPHGFPPNPSLASCTHHKLKGVNDVYSYSLSQDGHLKDEHLYKLDCISPNLAKFHICLLINNNN